MIFKIGKKEVKASENQITTALSLFWMIQKMVLSFMCHSLTHATRSINFYIWRYENTSVQIWTKWKSVGSVGSLHKTLYQSKLTAFVFDIKYTWYKYFWWSLIIVLMFRLHFMWVKNSRFNYHNCMNFWCVIGFFGTWIVQGIIFVKEFTKIR